MEIPNVQGKDLEVAAKGSGNLAVDIPDEVAGLFNIANNMEGVIPRLPQIKIIHRGQLFEMPDESKIEEFEGVILDQHPANAWWKKDMSESGGNKIPDCFSMDAIIPVENCENRQNDKCATCKQNQFGSDRKTGKGKDCKNMKRLHILMEGSLLPRRLTVPPTSIRSFESYVTNLTDRGLPYACVVSVFSLDKKESEGFEFAEVKFKKGKVLSREELLSIANFIKQYREAAREQEIQAEEYASSETSTDSSQEMNNTIPEDDEIPY